MVGTHQRDESMHSCKDYHTKQCSFLYYCEFHINYQVADVDCPWDSVLRSVGRLCMDAY